MRRIEALALIVLLVTVSTLVASSPAEATCPPLAYPELCSLDRPPSPAPRSPSQSGAAGMCDLPCDLRWESRNDLIPGARTFGVEGAMGAVIDGKILVSHGREGLDDLAVLREYDLATDSWAVLTAPNPAYPRSEGVGATVGGKLYALGGRMYALNEEYDPATGTWREAAPMSIERKGMAVGVIDDKIHVVGGSTGSNSGPHAGMVVDVHEVYDPVLDAWSPAAPLPVALTDIYAAAAIGDKLYVFGGWDGTQVVGTTYIYDAASDSWSTGAPMPTPRSNAAAGVLCGERIFVIGGLYTNALPNADEVEVYEPATDTWCSAERKPFAISETTTSGISTDTAIHIIGSGPGGAGFQTHEALVWHNPCLAADLAAVTELKGVEDGTGGATFSWDPDPGAFEYHLNTVTDKTRINDPDAKRPMAGTAKPQCSATATTCDDSDAIADGDLLFYQVFSACGPDGNDAGPFD